MSIAFGNTNLQAGANAISNIEDGNCAIDIDELGVRNTTGVGRVSVKPNGNVNATCDFQVEEDKKPEKNTRVTSFNCKIKLPVSSPRI